MFSSSVDVTPELDMTVLEGWDGLKIEEAMLTMTYH